MKDDFWTQHKAMQGPFRAKFLFRFVLAKFFESFCDQVTRLMTMSLIASLINTKYKILQTISAIYIIVIGPSHNIEFGPWFSKSVSCIQHSWTKKSPIKVQEDTLEDIECIHSDVYVVSDVVQLILCCSALNCTAAAADSRVTQLTNMQTKTET